LKRKDRIALEYPSYASVDIFYYYLLLLIPTKICKTK